MKLNNYETKWGFDEGIEFVMSTVKSHEDNINFEELKNLVAEKIKEKYEEI